MKTILITGGNGFLGRSLAKTLSGDFKVILGSRNNALNNIATNETGCESTPLDVTNYQSIKDALNLYKPEIIIHAAATKFVDLSEKFPLECSDVNVQGSMNIARASVDSEVKTVIGISTDKAAPPVANIYGLSKAIMERAFLSLNGINNTKFTCVRFGNIAWSTGSVFPIWKQMTDENNLINSSGPKMRRFFFNIDQAVDLVITSLENINIVNGKILSLKMKSAQISDILDLWCDYYKTKWKKVDKRLGDKDDEFIIGENEIKNTYEILISDKKYYLINFNKITKKLLKEPISSKNAEKLSDKEIIDLITYNNEKNN